jgi:hypothetical protein
MCRCGMWSKFYKNCGFWKICECYKICTEWLPKWNLQWRTKEPVRARNHDLREDKPSLRKNLWASNFLEQTLTWEHSLKNQIECQISKTTINKKEPETNLTQSPRIRMFRILPGLTYNTTHNAQRAVSTCENVVLVKTFLRRRWRTAISTLPNQQIYCHICPISKTSGYTNNRSLGSI